MIAAHMHISLNSHQALICSKCCQEEYMPLKFTFLILTDFSPPVYNDYHRVSY